MRLLGHPIEKDKQLLELFHIMPLLGSLNHLTRVPFIELTFSHPQSLRIEEMKFWNASVKKCVIILSSLIYVLPYLYVKLFRRTKIKSIYTNFVENIYKFDKVISYLCWNSPKITFRRQKSIKWLFWLYFLIFWALFFIVAKNPLMFLEVHIWTMQNVQNYEFRRAKFRYAVGEFFETCFKNMSGVNLEFRFVG